MQLLLVSLVGYLDPNGMEENEMLKCHSDVILGYRSDSPLPTVSRIITEMAKEPRSEWGLNGYKCTVLHLTCILFIQLTSKS